MRDITRRAERVILVVDDHPLIRMDTADMVKSCGCRPLEADNADEAIRRLENCAAIRFVITDVEMPGTMNGIELAKLIRERWPQIAIIIVSGRTSADLDGLPADISFLENLCVPSCSANISAADRISLGPVQMISLS